MALTCHTLRCLLALVLTATLIVDWHRNTCSGFAVYFPLSSVKLNLPFNEKSQSIFSKIPIGRFQVLAAANNSVATDYIYSLEQNDLLRINGTTGEVFMRNDYRVANMNVSNRLTLTAIPRSLRTATNIPHMSLEVQPQTAQQYCNNLENVCFWTAAHFTLLEDGSAADFVPLRVGALNPRGAKLFCPTQSVKYALAEGSNHFSLRDNVLYTRVALDYETLNASEPNRLTATVMCSVRTKPNSVSQFRKQLNVTLIDRNDNGPQLQNSSSSYHFHLADPHFKANDYIGDKIIFVDKDSVQTNSPHQTFNIHNDTNQLARPECKLYDADHVNKRYTVISCQIVFTRNGILSQPSYCFTLEVSDLTVDANVTNSASALICLHADVSKIHEADRPTALALRTRQNRKYTSIVNSEEGLLQSENGNSGNALLPSVLSTYPKDAYVYRTAAMYSRVAQQEDLESLMKMPRLRFAIAEDRSGAFGVTANAGIIYVKDNAALQRAPETVYFVNITWADTYQRSFVVNVHLVEGRPENASCEHKVKSRSQTCAQIKYQKQCIKFCGLATSGGACNWRGTNAGFFTTNYASCVPDAKFCPDNICDPLEDLNSFICPQDCTPGLKIMGPHSVNNNKRGILSASGTCICEDNGKCSCAPLDDDEPKAKRKRKNDPKADNAMGKQLAIESKRGGPPHGAGEEQGIRLGGFVCGKQCMIISLACPIVFVMLIACLLISRRNIVRRARGKEAASMQKFSGIGGNTSGECDVRNGDLPLLQLENEFKFEGIESKWEFDRDHLVLDVVLGEGEFGKVVKGYATDIAGIKGTTTVAVKMLKNNANSVEHMALLSEFQLLQEVSHPNVIKLLGACTKENSPMIIIEYARYGSLRSYLRLSRKIECSGVDFTDGVEPITVKNILSFAWQICKGMAYLTEIKLVHRDLAARNVLLADGKICKISDFGLTRDVYEDDAYLKRSRDRVPVKWMAPESLADHVYTTKSDVWAFGVLCWELITLGASPYPGVPPQNLYHLLRSGYRMERPENCSEEVYSVIRSCWADDPNGRPSFKYLASQFEKLLGNNAKYIKLESNAVSNPYYCTDEPNTGSVKSSKTDLTELTNDGGDPESLDHLWHPPKITYDLHDWQSIRDFSSNFSAEFQPPPGYDMPRPLIEAATTEQKLRYENDLRFPLNIRKSICTASIKSSSQNGSKCDIQHYAVPVKRGRSYMDMDMTNKTFLPDNLDNVDFDKHITKAISFRFSSVLNLKDQDDQV